MMNVSLLLECSEGLRDDECFSLLECFKVMRDEECFYY